MRTSVIMERLLRGGKGAVFPEEYSKFSQQRFRLWILKSDIDKRDLKELRKLFLNMKDHDRLLKLGECTSLSSANQFLSCAREKYGLFLIPPVRRKEDSRPRKDGIKRCSSKRRVITM
ncbi:MAG TPA: hypothetical protein VMV66_03450 [Candidatus Humimicrobiaceae bacterium]|nr:hypothetical protein [Candidatus Humimicrobiaceae bacterium]